MRREWSFVEALACRCPPSIVLFVERDTYGSLSINLVLTHLAVSSGRKGKEIFLSAVQKEKF